MFCKHKWELLSDVTTKSMLEHAHDHGMTITDGYASMLTRKHIQTFTCEKCGKVKRFVEMV